MNNLNYVCFDLETGGLDYRQHETIQVAAIAYDPRTLEPYPAEQGGVFCSLMKPLYPERLQDAALKVNGKTREELAAAPDQKLVWNQFVAWVKKWNIKGGSPFGAPIACGKNIRDFDMHFVHALNALHSPKKEKTVLFQKRRQLELEDLVFAWFENERLPEKMTMDALREFFGMSTEKSHDALVDATQTGQLVMKFLSLHRELQRRKSKDGSKFIKFQGCFATQVSAA